MTTSSLRSENGPYFRHKLQMAFDNRNITVDNSSVSEQSSKSGSQFKVSEIVNPDGSVTIRNLLIKEDGIWTKQEQEIDNRQYERIHQSHFPDILSSTFNLQDRTQNAADGTPVLDRANSFQSNSSSCSSVEYADKYRSEATAHRLRRQRLAQSSFFFDTSESLAAETPSPIKHSQHEGQKLIPSLFAGGTPPISRSYQQSRPTATMKTNSTIPLPTKIFNLSDMRPCKPTNKKSSRKHVAFSEPLSPSESKQNEDTVSSGVGLNNQKNDFYHHMGMDNSAIHDSNDVETRGHRSVKQSFSSADSSVFDDVAQISNVDKILGQLELRSSWGAESQSQTQNEDSDNDVHLPNLFSVTVHKNSQADRIGIFVHLETFSFGNRLVISKIAPDGKFANTRIKEGDIVVSINGKDMVEDPNLQKALTIVTSAPDSVTIVVHKNFEVNDIQSATQTSISSISKDLSSISYHRDHSQNNGKNRRVFRGSIEVNDAAKAKVIMDDVTKRERMTGDGSMLISEDSEILEPLSIRTNESWKLSGVIVISIEKKSSLLEKPGLQIGIKESSNGHVLYIADVHPSSMFAKTPLRIGDIIISINSVSLFDNADIVDAYSALGKPCSRITLVAKKGEESLQYFLLGGKNHPVLPQDGITHTRRESFNTALTSQTSGTTATTPSGESSRHVISAGSANNSILTENTASSLSAGPGMTCKDPTGIGSTGLEDTEIEKNVSSNKACESKPEKILENITNGDSSCASIRNAGRFVPILEQIEQNKKSISTSTTSLSNRWQEDGGKTKKRRQKVLITVTKENQGQKIGIDFAELNNKLVVAEVSPTGLLRNAPLVFGDTLLSINGTSFQLNPVLEEAYSLVKNAPEKVTLEILKTEHINKQIVDDSRTKSCIPGTLFCSKRRSRDHAYQLEQNRD